MRILQWGRSPVGGPFPALRLVVGLALLGVLFSAGSAAWAAGLTVLAAGATEYTVRAVVATFEPRAATP